MSITVKPVTPDFVAEISGLDRAQPLKPVHSHGWKQGDLVIASTLEQAA